MSNAEAIAKTMKEEYGYDIYNGESYAMTERIVLKVKGVVKVYRPKEG